MTMIETKSASRIVWMALCVSLLAPAVASADMGDQRAKFTASDASYNARFGHSVAISGNTAIIGTWAGHSEVGKVYLFDVATGMESGRLFSEDGIADDNFGFSVGMSGNTAIVGAFGRDGGDVDTGTAYLFDTRTGAQLAQLSSGNTDLRAEFGRSVGVSGNTAIVGARNEDGHAGAAYLFDVTTGNQLARLAAFDRAGSDRFGHAVAISGNVAIVGSYADDDYARASGSAYLYDARTGRLLHKLTADDASENAIFGDSVAIEGNIAIVGAKWDTERGGNAGAAYLFDVTTGRQLHKLIGHDTTVHDSFGYSVSISGQTAIVGAFKNAAAGSSSGAAYLFDVATGRQLTKVIGDDTTGGDFFGCAVGMSDDVALIGAESDDDFGSWSGSVYHIEVPEPATFSLLALGGLAMIRRRHLARHDR